MVRHITSWQINGEKEETATNFIFLGSKITADSECSHEIERHLLLGRKAMTNLDSPLKSRHHFTNKGVYSQRYGFPVVMYGCFHLAASLILLPSPRVLFHRSFLSATERLRLRLLGCVSTVMRFNKWLTR